MVEILPGDRISTNSGENVLNERRLIYVFPVYGLISRITTSNLRKIRRVFTEHRAVLQTYGTQKNLLDEFGDGRTDKNVYIQCSSYLH